MRIDWMEKVLLKLVGKGALAYALHPDGLLSVVDRKGQKHWFSAADYQHLMPSQLKPPASSQTLRGQDDQS